MKPALPSSWSLETWAAGPGHPGVHVEIPPAEVSLGSQEVFLGRGSGNPQPLSSPGVLVRAHVFCRGDAAHTCRLRAADSLPLTVSPEQLVSLRPLLFRFPRHKTCPANSADVGRAPLVALRLPLKAVARRGGGTAGQRQARPGPLSSFPAHPVSTRGRRPEVSGQPSPLPCWALCQQLALVVLGPWPKWRLKELHAVPTKNVAQLDYDLGHRLWNLRGYGP